MTYGRQQNRTARELENATTNAANLIEELEEKVAELETEATRLGEDVESAEEDNRALQDEIDRLVARLGEAAWRGGASAGDARGTTRHVYG